MERSRALLFFSMFALSMISGCVCSALEGGSGSGTRFHLNHVYYNSADPSQVILDINYTPSNPLAEPSIDFVPGRFDMKVNGRECGFMPIEGEENQTGAYFEGKKTIGLGNTEHIIFDLEDWGARRFMQSMENETVMQNMRLFVLGEVGENCTAAGNGANVTILISVTEDQNDISDVFDPYSEMISSKADVLNESDFSEICRDHSLFSCG